MDIAVVQQRIRASLRRPPAVRPCPRRPAVSRVPRAPGLPDEVWVTSFADLLEPGRRMVDQPTAGDPLPQAATAQLRAALDALGIDAALTESLTDVALACATVATPDEQPAVVSRAQALLGTIETLTSAAAHLEATVLSAARQLTAANGQLLLLDKGASTPEELTVRQRETWRAKAKSVTRHEVEAAIGWAPGEVSDLIALANTPHTVRGPVSRALRTGEGSWRLARRFYRECAGLDTDDAAAIANGLFGDDPGTAVTERLDSTGEWLGGPWRHKEFYRVLDREVHQVRSRDPEAIKKTREQALGVNDVGVRVDKLGTATVTIGCGATQGAAIADRIEKAARAARKGGDKRTLRQLRVAVAVSLLLHGTLDVSDLPEDPALITVEQSEQLTKILHGLPSAELNVIVPLNTLIGTTPAGLIPVTAEEPGPTGQLCPPPQAEPAGDIGCPPPQAEPAGDVGCPPPQAGSAGEVGCPPPQAEPAGEVGVGEVVGRHSLFLSPDEVRTLALTPGSTLYRLLTDPATGNLIERSTTAYRFDTAMRAHIIASDVFCRAPGCLRPASLSQIDHVQEHGTPGGHTCVGNGQAAHEPHHDLKTKKLWDAVMHANRDVTWTTLVGRIYTTKAHDYRQYTKLLIAATEQVEDAIAAGEDPATAVDAAVYQALSYRPPGTTLEAEDDDDWNELFTGWDLITLTHTTETGRRSYHPDPDTAQAETARLEDTRHGIRREDAVSLDPAEPTTADTDPSPDGTGSSWSSDPSSWSSDLSSWSSDPDVSPPDPDGSPPF